MSTLRLFEEPVLAASTFLVGGSESNLLDVRSEDGVLTIPQGVRPQGFYLMLFLPKKGNRTFITQKKVGTEAGDYHNKNIREFSVSGELVGYKLQRPIEVRYERETVWTPWHDEERTNRADCFYVGEDGSFYLYQVGIITHDNGATYRLHGEYRWKGKLSYRNSKTYLEPEDPKWGSFTQSRAKIFENPNFRAFYNWTSSRPELVEPVLAPVSGPGFARVEWYVSFGGQTGQGIAIGHESQRRKAKPKNPNEKDEGLNFWIHGTDIQESPDPDGVKRLWSGQLISYSGTEHFGTQKGRPPKLLNIKKVG